MPFNMIVIDRTMLLHAILGTSPKPFGKAFQKFSFFEYGHWTGGFVDEWSWDTDKMKHLSEEDLLEMYTEMRNENEA